jgi:hypothetical protein
LVDIGVYFVIRYWCLLMAIDGYYIYGYWWIFYYWIFVDILLLDIGGY